MRGGDTDTDTNAAIAGALLGAVHGRDTASAQWVERVLHRRPEAGREGVHPVRLRCYVGIASAGIWHLELKYQFRPTTTSSSVRVRRAGSGSTGSRKAPTSACFCWRPPPKRVKVV